MNTSTRAFLNHVCHVPWVARSQMLVDFAVQAGCCLGVHLLAQALLWGQVGLPYGGVLQLTVGCAASVQRPVGA